MQNPPPLPTLPGSAKLKRELCGFMLFLGLLLGLAGYFLLSKDSVSKTPIWGVSRNLAWGAPTLIFAVIHILSGLGIIFTSSRFAVYFGMIGAIGLALFYCTIMVASTGTLPITLITLVVIAIPVLVIQRGWLLLKNHKPTNNIPRPNLAEQ